MTLERLRSERGGCIGCVVPCAVIVLIAAAGTVLTLAAAVTAIVRHF